MIIANNLSNKNNINTNIYINNIIINHKLFSIIKILYLLDFFIIVKKKKK